MPLHAASHNTNPALAKWEAERYARLMQRKIKGARSAGYAATAQPQGPNFVLVLQPDAHACAGPDTDAPPDAHAHAADSRPARPGGFLASLTAPPPQHTAAAAATSPAAAAAATEVLKLLSGKAAAAAGRRQAAGAGAQPGLPSNTGCDARASAAADKRQAAARAAGRLRPAWNDRFTAAGCAGGRVVPPSTAATAGCCSILDAAAPRPAGRMRQQQAAAPAQHAPGGKGHSSSKLWLVSGPCGAGRAASQRYQALPAAGGVSASKLTALQPVAAGPPARPTPETVAAAAAEALRLLSRSRRRRAGEDASGQPLSALPRLPQLARRSSSASSGSGGKADSLWGSDAASRCASSSASSRGGSRGEPRRQASVVATPGALAQQPSLGLLGASIELQRSEVLVLPRIQQHAGDGAPLGSSCSGWLRAHGAWLHAGAGDGCATASDAATGLRPASAAIGLSCEGSAEVLLGACSSHGSCGSAGRG